MAPFFSKALSITEKFRAPAALWRPSQHARGGWVETSGIGRGGQIIIQMQENSDDTEGPVAVVRFVLRHGQDVLNARILNGLPIYRSAENEILFKSASTSTYKVRWKTTFRIKFETFDDTDDFLMWWYAKNGSIKALIEESSNKKHKRKSTEQIGGKEKKPRIQRSDNNESTKRDESAKGKLKYPLRVLVESTNVKQRAVASNKSAESKINNISILNDDPTSSTNEKEEVMIDDDDAPQSQNWFASFEEYE